MTTTLDAPSRSVERPTLGQRIVRMLTTTDHKLIGKLYLGTSFAWFLAGGIMALLIRSELAFPGQQVVKIVNEELANLMGGTAHKLTFASRPPTVVMLAGLNGHGKTTTAGKLALFTRKLGKNPYLVACDTYRPAAIDQLQQIGRERRFTLAADVLFAFDRADLRPEADTALRKFLTQLGPQTARASLRIEGHTDGKGADAYNDRLAMERARSVQAWLGDRGSIPIAAMNTAGFGKRRPVAPNTRTDGSDDPDGRQRNRRVEIVVQGP